MADRPLSPLGNSLRFTASVVAILAGALGVWLVLEYLPKPGNSAFWLAVYDSGHGLLFAVFSVFSMLLIRPLVRPERIWPLAYMISLGLALVFGTAMEVAQFFGDRDAQIGDVARNFFGAAAALAAVATLDRRALAKPGRSRRRRFRHNAAAAVTVLITVLFCVQPVLSAMRSYEKRDTYFPLLMPSNETWSYRFLSHLRAHVEVVAAPLAMTDIVDAQCMRITAMGQGYAGLSINETLQDWTRYPLLSVPVYVFGDQPISLIVRLEDRWKAWEINEWTDQHMIIPPGYTEVKLRLAEQVIAQTKRPLELDNVRRVVIAIRRPTGWQQICVGNVRLSKD